VGIQCPKKTRRRAQHDPPDWSIAYRLCEPVPAGRGWTYRQVNEMTLAQIRHAMSDPKRVAEEKIADMIVEASDARLDKICDRLGVWPFELLHFPYQDILGQIKLEDPTMNPHPLAVQNLLIEYIQGKEE
jgi:hypothetical protein